MHGLGHALKVLATLHLSTLVLNTLVRPYCKEGNAVATPEPYARMLSAICEGTAFERAAFVLSNPSLAFGAVCSLRGSEAWLCWGFALLAARAAFALIALFTGKRETAHTLDAVLTAGQRCCALAHLLVRSFLAPLEPPSASALWFVHKLYAWDVISEILFPGGLLVESVYAAATLPSLVVLFTRYNRYHPAEAAPLPGIMLREALALAAILAAEAWRLRLRRARRASGSLASGPRAAPAALSSKLAPGLGCSGPSPCKDKGSHDGAGEPAYGGAGGCCDSAFASAQRLPAKGQLAEAGPLPAAEGPGQASTSAGAGPCAVAHRTGGKAVAGQAGDTGKHEDGGSGTAWPRRVSRSLEQQVTPGLLEDVGALQPAGPGLPLPARATGAVLLDSFLSSAPVASRPASALPVPRALLSGPAVLGSANPVDGSGAERVQQAAATAVVGPIIAEAVAFPRLPREIMPPPDWTALAHSEPWRVDAVAQRPFHVPRYTGRTRLLTRRIKIRGGADPEHIPPGFERRIEAALAKAGLVLEGVYVRRGCIEVVVDARRISDRGEGDEEGDPSDPSESIDIGAIIRALELPYDVPYDSGSASRSADVSASYDVTVFRKGTDLATDVAPDEDAAPTVSALHDSIPCSNRGPADTAHAHAQRSSASLLAPPPRVLTVQSLAVLPSSHANRRARSRALDDSDGFDGNGESLQLTALVWAPDARPFEVSARCMNRYLPLAAPPVISWQPAPRDTPAAQPPFPPPSNPLGPAEPPALPLGRVATVTVALVLEKLPPAPSVLSLAVHEPGSFSAAPPMPVLMLDDTAMAAELQQGLAACASAGSAACGGAGASPEGLQELLSDLGCFLHHCARLTAPSAGGAGQEDAEPVGSGSGGGAGVGVGGEAVQSPSQLRPQLVTLGLDLLEWFAYTAALWPLTTARLQRELLGMGAAPRQLRLAATAAAAAAAACSTAATAAAAAAAAAATTATAVDAPGAASPLEPGSMHQLSTSAPGALPGRHRALGGPEHVAAAAAAATATAGEWAPQRFTSQLFGADVTGQPPLLAAALSAPAAGTQQRVAAAAGREPAGGGSPAGSSPVTGLDGGVAGPSFTSLSHDGTQLQPPGRDRERGTASCLGGLEASRERGLPARGLKPRMGWIARGSRAAAWAGVLLVIAGLTWLGRQGDGAGYGFRLGLWAAGTAAVGASAQVFDLGVMLPAALVAPACVITCRAAGLRVPLPSLTGYALGLTALMLLANQVAGALRRLPKLQGRSEGPSGGGTQVWQIQPMSPCGCGSGAATVATRAKVE
ncbi:hypothetical protein HYH03_001522 [Edaphochlamys debaryana]|uniref:Uncharacterized protein n=1 Tax=Edaphochlamys debaryana TaxID=47281 RepID=A0A835YD97_9CHLO|nr:hypothetical protein HYH03_001522 [Edaphochlamys debaryana]|eukprot:KAG2500760.1 hypothetical protein HYH03_001522 [Edaphochlamys debaryana]